jgi:polar amino acid transport system ATP-binding protein
MTNVATGPVWQGKVRILEQGPPDRLFNHPQNERTQAFLRAVLES